VLAALGASAAVWQHVVAAKSSSCNLTLADKVITALRVEAVAPWLFEVKATCADAAVSLFGVPYEYWSLALFVLLRAGRGAGARAAPLKTARPCCTWQRRRGRGTRVDSASAAAGAFQGAIMPNTNAGTVAADAANSAEPRPRPWGLAA
jgi:hypothetical protein